MNRVLIMQELKYLSEEKECSRCHQFKPREQFSKDKSRKGGLTHRCKVCQKVCYKECRERWALERSRGQIEVPTEKECKKCRKVKPVSDFTKSNNRKDGIDYFCKTCKSKHRITMISKWKEERNENIINIKVKTCNKCLKLLPVSHFNNSINSKNGFDSICRVCSMELTQEYKRKWTEERNNPSSSVVEKSCPSCNRILPLSSFYGTDYTKDGLRAYCIECELQNAELNVEKWSEERLQNEEITKEKVCNICHRMLPVTEFHKSRRYKDGLWATCIDCQKTRLAEYIKQWKDSSDGSDEIIVAKECNVCREVLPVSCFSQNKKHKDGLLGTCKDCIETRHQKYMVKWKNEEFERNIDLTKAESLFPSFEKECVTCHKLLPITSFYRSIRKKDGFASSCKDCKKTIAKELRKRIKKKM